MKRVKYLILAILPMLLLSCGFIEKTKMENKVGEKLYAELSESAFGDVAPLCDISVDLGSKEENGNYSGRIFIKNTKTGASAEIPVIAWMDGEEVVYQSITNDSETAAFLAVLDTPDERFEEDDPEFVEIEDEEEEKIAEEVKKEEEVIKEDIFKKEEVKEEPLFTEEETVTEEVVNGVPSWLFGKWTCSTAYGTETMWISKDGVRSKSGNIEDTGSYTYSNGELRIQFSRERGVVTSIPVDVVNRRLEYGGGYYWVKSN